MREEEAHAAGLHCTNRSERLVSEMQGAAALQQLHVATSELEELQHAYGMVWEELQAPPIP